MDTEISEFHETLEVQLGCDFSDFQIFSNGQICIRDRYREYAVLEEVFLGDMVTVINTKMGFRKQAKVISYEWYCLLEQYNEVELGDFIPTLAASVTSGVKSGSLASSAYINACLLYTSSPVQAAVRCLALRRTAECPQATSLK